MIRERVRLIQEHISSHTTKTGIIIGISITLCILFLFTMAAFHRRSTARANQGNKSKQVIEFKLLNWTTIYPNIRNKSYSAKSFDNPAFKSPDTSKNGNKKVSFDTFKNEIKLDVFHSTTTVISTLKSITIKTDTTKNDTESESADTEDDTEITSATELLITTHKNLILTTAIPFNVFKYQYKFLTNLDHKCKQNDSIDVVYLISTTFLNYERRLAIRQTWASEIIRTFPGIRRVFLMGVDPINDTTIRNEILHENQSFGDILLGDYFDHFDNDSLKMISGLQWAKNYCNNSKFYVKTDDMAFFSTKNLLQFLDVPANYDLVAKFSNTYFVDDKNMSRIPRRKFEFYGGYLFPGSSPVREGKWAVSQEEFPYDVYPPYVNGHAVLLSRDTLKPLLEAAKYTKFFRLDDVYLGMLAAWAGIPASNVDNIAANHPVYTGSLEVQEFDRLIATHHMPSAQEALRIWNLLNARGNA